MINKTKIMLYITKHHLNERIKVYQLPMFLQMLHDSAFKEKKFSKLLSFRISTSK